MLPCWCYVALLMLSAARYPQALPVPVPLSSTQVRAFSSNCSGWSHSSLLHTVQWLAAQLLGMLWLCTPVGPAVAARPPAVSGERCTCQLAVVGSALSRS